MGKPEITNPDIARTDNGVTPLFVAAGNGYIDVVTALLRANANPDKAATSDTTPLHVAAQNDNWRGIHRSNILVGPNIFSETTYKIKYSSPNQDVYTEYIFASVENIKSINFVYGNDL